MQTLLLIPTARRGSTSLKSLFRKVEFLFGCGNRIVLTYYAVSTGSAFTLSQPSII